MTSKRARCVIPLTNPATINTFRIFRGSAGLLFAVLVLLSGPCLAQPQVTKIEPPNWWTNYVSPVMVLLYGDGMTGANITVDYPGVTVQKVEAQPDGKHAFVWLAIANDTKPGDVTITVKTPSGSTQANLELSARQPQRGR